MNCREKVKLENGYALEVRCSLAEGHTGQHWHSNYVPTDKDTKAYIDITWGED